jgi:hypothetical protein
MNGAHRQENKNRIQNTHIRYVISTLFIANPSGEATSKCNNKKGRVQEWFALKTTRAETHSSKVPDAASVPDASVLPDVPDISPVI